MTGVGGPSGAPAPSSPAVRIRPARPDDEAALATLLGELGYPATAGELRGRIAELAGSAADTVLVAEAGGLVVGMASLHVVPFFNEGRSRGRVTALVVDAGQRGRGVGRRLLAAIEAVAADRGCAAIELTSSATRREAHRFYLANGYEDVPHRFLKPLGPPAATVTAEAYRRRERRAAWGRRRVMRLVGSGRGGRVGPRWPGRWPGRGPGASRPRGRPGGEPGTAIPGCRG